MVDHSRRERLAATDAQYASAVPDPNVVAAMDDRSLSLGALVRTVMSGYADRPALGTRSHRLDTEPETGRTVRTLLPHFDTTTYAELWSTIGAVSAAWRGELDLRPGDFVALLGFTSADYAALDMACIHTGAVSVPLQSSATADALRPILLETAPRIVAAGVDFLATAVAALDGAHTPDRVVVFDYLTDVDDHRETLQSARDALGPHIVVTLDEMISRGCDLAPGDPYEPADGENPLATIFYTSGSTGTPKGAMYLQSTLATPWRGMSTEERGPRRHPSIHLNFLPMSHLYGRMWLFGTFAAGGTAYFAAAQDLSTLFEDFALVRPTALNLVPRVCEMIAQRFQSEVARAEAAGVDEKAARERAKVVVREDLLGGRVIFALCGTAPLAPELHELISWILDTPISDGYGSTESGILLQGNVIQRPPVIDYKLVDVPELGYFATDKPHPRGELLVKSTTMFPGYYKRPEVTAEMFTDDGYYMTGDVMAEIEPDRLVYVDRRKNVIKLAQGEFVAVSKLEAIYVNCPEVQQIYVYGNSERSYLLAVVVPARDARELSPTRIVESLTHIGSAAGVNPYEIPRAVLIEHEPFTEAAGLLSGVGKLLRPALGAKYGNRLEALYAELAGSRERDLDELRARIDTTPVLVTVVRAARILLDYGSEDPASTAHFTDLGGDSLSALTYSTLLGELFDVDVPVSLIVGPTTTLSGVAAHIDRARIGGGERPTYASVHGAGAATVRAADLTLEAFLDAETLRAAETLPDPSPEPRTVLLTGANGYLGRFLCLEWLERVAATGGTVVAIVRGSDDADARRRLDDAFDSGDTELIRRYQSLAREHLEVVAGDIGEARMGLSESTWNRLADNVDHIVHPAALVNHVLPYSHFFGPNVVGTAELIRLALTTRLKGVDYLSTVAVAVGIAPTTFEENGDIRTMSPERTVDKSYANGYGTSKWAGEVLLREAHERYGVPVAVFRSDMIMAHSRFRGQLNVPDAFTRLILSLLLTGVAPRSFYAPGPDGLPARSHYDGLPVDFTAAAVAGLAASERGRFTTYDVTNPHADGISLDTFVDWLIDQGHRIERIDDYADWVRRFETALKALPVDQRSASLLPLLHAYAYPSPARNGSAIPADGFRAAVQRAGLGSDRDVPHLGPELIAKYVSDLEPLLK